MAGAPFVARVGECLALVVQLAYAALIHCHVNLPSPIGILFWIIVKALLARFRTEVIFLTLIVAPVLGVFVCFHPTYWIFHTITIKSIHLLSYSYALQRLGYSFINCTLQSRTCSTSHLHHHFSTLTYSSLHNSYNRRLVFYP